MHARFGPGPQESLKSSVDSMFSALGSTASLTSGTLDLPSCAFETSGTPVTSLGLRVLRSFETEVFKGLTKIRPDLESNFLIGTQSVAPKLRFANVADLLSWNTLNKPITGMFTNGFFRMQQTYLPSFEKLVELDLSKGLTILAKTKCAGSVSKYGTRYASPSLFTCTYLSCAHL